MFTLETLNNLLITNENEHIDFKEAKQQYDMIKLLRYCVAFANECGGHLILGISDKLPRRIVGTKAFPNIGEVKSQILNKLHFRVEIYELIHPDGRVLVFEIPSRPQGQPQHLDGTYFMRSGEELVPMTPDQLRRIFSEDEPKLFIQPAKSDIDKHADNISIQQERQKTYEIAMDFFDKYLSGAIKEGAEILREQIRANRWLMSAPRINYLIELRKKAIELDCFSHGLEQKRIIAVQQHYNREFKTREQIEWHDSITRVNELNLWFASKIDNIDHDLKIL